MANFGFDFEFGCLVNINQLRLHYLLFFVENISILTHKHWKTEESLKETDSGISKRAELLRLY